MGLIHLGLLALAVFCVWETVRAVLPWQVPGAAIALILLALAYLLDTFVPDRWLALAAVVSVVGVLQQRFGSAREETHTVSLPRRDRIPPLPR